LVITAFLSRLEPQLEHYGRTKVGTSRLIPLFSGAAPTGKGVARYTVRR
jgi:hypothetical protein